MLCALKLFVCLLDFFILIPGAHGGYTLPIFLCELSYVMLVVFFKISVTVLAECFVFVINLFKKEYFY